MTDPHVGVRPPEKLGGMQRTRPRFHQAAWVWAPRGRVGSVAVHNVAAERGQDQILDELGR
jgi:hypothetical protein